MMRSCWFLLPLLFAACGHRHPLDGNWEQVLPDGKDGIDIQFDAQSDKVLVHTAPRVDGTHDHIDGTYTFDKGGHLVTVKAKMMGETKAELWTGKVDGEQLELSSADGKLAFKRGGQPHEHH